MGEGESALERISSWASEFCERELRSYTDRLKSRRIISETREINDPIWATISLTPFETVIVDSPLFQRLRRIRQLGVVHWVYPGCVHTRFEHSLGALHQVQQLVDSINRAAAQNETPALNQERAALLRFCALCHDVGYGAMSHVLENAVISFEKVNEIFLQFGRKHKIAPPLSEIVAYHMLGSPVFSEMVQQARAVTTGPHPPPDLVERTQKAITGQIVDAEMPIFHELISGPFDADKLDYMQRDAVMAGIPAITDVPRLVRKVRARWVERNQLPPRIAKHVDDRPLYLMFGIAFSGARTLDELLIARVLLFDKVYRHQKVRALEGMVARLLEALASVYEGDVFEILFLFSDESLLQVDRFLPGTKGFDLSVSGGAKFGIIQDLCSRLRDRRLFVRAFVFAMHFPELDKDTNSHRGMAKFVDEAQSSRIGSLVEEIAKEIKTVIAKLGGAVKTPSDTTLRSHLWLDPPTKRDHSEKVAHAILLKENGDLIRYSEHSREVPRWAQAYLAKKDVGYLFCVPELQTCAFLAVEKLVADGKYQFRIPKSALAYLKLDDQQISEFRERLHDEGYYQSVPFTTRPWRSRLRTAHTKQCCESIVESLRGYVGPPSDSEAVQLSNERIQLWLAQFEDDALIDVALRVLEKIRLFGRTEFAAAVRTFISANEAFANGIIVPLGDPKDSGSVVAYLGQDTGLEVRPLGEALGQSRPIILVDDGIGSGSQADDIVADWFGQAKDGSLNEGKRLSLTTEQQAQLAELPIGFVFTTGLSNGTERLQQVCNDHSLQSTIHVEFKENQLPTLFDQDLAGLAKHVDFVSRCKIYRRRFLKQRTLNGADQSETNDCSDTETRDYSLHSRSTRRRRH